MATSRPLLDAGCCAPVLDVGLDQAAAAEAAATFKALSDPARLRLLSIVAAHPDGEVCVCDLTGPVGLSQPTVSHHMGALVKAGLVTREQRGKWAYFRLADDARRLIDATAGAVLGAPELVGAG